MKNKYTYFDTNNFSKVLLLILAILFFFLESPNFIFYKGFGFLGWFAYVPILLLVKKTSIKFVWSFGAIFGFFSYCLSGYWLFFYEPFALFLVCVFYAFILAFVFFILKLCDYIFKVNGWLLQWAFLCLYEYFKTLGFMGLNYGVTAYTQWRYPLIIQICDLTGVFGLNAVMIFMSVVVYAIIQKVLERKFVITQLLIGQEKKNIKSHITYSAQKESILKSTSLKNPIIAAILLCLMIIFIFIYGMIKLQDDKIDGYKTITVAAIQNNDLSSKSTTEDYTKNVRNLISLTDEARDYNPNIKIVVWPETAVVPAIIYHYNEKKDLMRYTIIKSVLDYINLDELTFVLGNGHYGELKKNYHEKYNSALVFEGKKNTIPPDPEIYIKQHLVPFSEYFPWENRFPKASKILQNGQNTFWTPGKESNVFNSKGLNFSTLICFEDTFTYIAREMYLNGSRCYLNLSNDSWSESVACQNQHLAMAVFRSVENRVPTVRSTSSGETCIINTKGKIVAKAPDFCLSYVIGEIPIIPESEGAGFYTTYGDFCGWGISFIIILMLLIKIFIVIINTIRLRLKYH